MVLLETDEKIRRVLLPYRNRKDFEQFFEFMSKEEEAALSPLVRQWKKRLVAAAGREPIRSAGQTYRTTMTAEMHAALMKWAKATLGDYQKDVPGQETVATRAAKGIIKWLKDNH